MGSFASLPSIPHDDDVRFRSCFRAETAAVTVWPASTLAVQMGSQEVEDDDGGGGGGS